MELVEKVALITNSILLTLVIGGTCLFVWKLKLGSKNKVLLFVLFILYWMAPLMCREYTGQIHIHQPNYDYGSLLWVPLTVYGLAGLLWRPLTDIISYKMKSRKNVLFLSLGIQLLTIWPMFVWPASFAVNIIQSVGTGIGASGIGLFNLMFSHEEHHRKVFTTVSILALPPLIAEFITSCMEAILCGLVPEHGQGLEYPTTIYLDYLKYLWLFAIVFIVISFVLAIFIKEERNNLFSLQQSKEAIKTKHNWAVLVLILLVGVCFLFVRWTTAGPSSVTQLIYIAVGQWKHTQNLNPIYPQDLIEEVKFFEGYLSCMFAFGQLGGTVVAGLILSKHHDKSKLLLIAAGAAVWLVYLTTNTRIINVHLYFWSNMLNGLGYGLIYPVLIGIIMNKHFKKIKIITPIGLFNTAMVIGVCGSSVFNNVIKGTIYDFHYEPSTSMIADFDKANALVNYVVLGVTLLMAALFVISYFIEKKYPPLKEKVKINYAIGTEMEI